MFQASLESERSRGYVPGHALASRYELIRLLGEGGTGVVWVAHDRVLNLEVAVKLVRSCEVTSDDFARRAQTEARSAARLAHPAVCRAMDFGLSTYGEPFIVSELLGGESLDDSLERHGRLSATHAVRILLPILDALGAAHECGIVHRDVKPANIFLAREGQQRLQPKLLDFGIAIWLGDARTTSDTGICGTPDYMSPEQARGSDHIDARSDLWNFSATLYEVLTGVVPFRGETVGQVFRAVQSVDPEPITTFCTGDAALSAIVLRGLDRNPDERWQSAGELAAELCSWLLGLGFETDICEHSLRARLVDRTGPESGHDTPYAHVVPRRTPDGGSRPAPDGERAPGLRAGIQRWKGLWLAAAIGAVLVATASFFHSLAPDHEPIAHAVAPAALAPPRAPTVEPVPPPIVAPRTIAGDALSAAPIVGAPPARTTSVAPPPPSPSVSDARAKIARSPAHAARTTAPSASFPPEQVPPPPPPATPPSARSQSTNALNYDFGF